MNKTNFSLVGTTFLQCPHAIPPTSRLSYSENLKYNETKILIGGNRLDRMAQSTFLHVWVNSCRDSKELPPSTGGVGGGGGSPGKF